MTAIIKCFCLIFIVSLITKGDCQYPLDKVRVSQSPTGALIHDKPEWKLTISNTIPCSLQNLTLACTGFQTVEEVDPSIMAKVGDKCLIYNGQPVYPFSSVNFNYAWDTSFPFRVVYAQITCS